MANTYSATILQDARAWIKEDQNKTFEQRKPFSQIFEMFKDTTNLSIPNLDQIRKSAIQPTKAMYKKRATANVGAAKSCTPSGQTGGTGDYTLTWVTATWSVKQQTKKFLNNELSPEQALAYNLMEFEASFWQDSFEQTLLAALETYKTQVNALSSGSGHNTWNAAADLVEVAAADQDRFYNYLVSEMQLNNYNGRLLDLSNTLWSAETAYQGAQTASNSTNLQFQYQNAMDRMVKRYASNHVDVSGYYSSLHYVVPEGGIGILDWNDPLNLKGFKDGDREWSTYRSIYKPGVNFDLFITNGCADTTNDGGSPQDRVINYEFALNYALFVQPSTVANESPIFKYGILR